ncbi:uncharacterized protein [Triticum aestivum]|uniref:uncharacterized protein n=1 Tax=Triticum aestivum TaxID=4565 RepID=UPI001D021987|nr:uncharacterized protein LOC123041572 [Triticum aestivum]
MDPSSCAAAPPTMPSSHATAVGATNWPPLVSPCVPSTPKSPSPASHGSVCAAAHQKDALMLPDAAFLKHSCAPKVNATQFLPPATPPTSTSGSEGTRRQRVGGKCIGEQLPRKYWNIASKCMRGRP